ncbi:MAG: response regulator, partial [Candidatus Omnitrophota bacterium]
CEGYEVINASCAVDANELIKKVKPDLVLLDINMPEVDGSLVYQIIDMFHKRTKVIVCSVRCLEDQRKIIEGAEDYYDKSHGIDVLRGKVRGILENE